MVSGAALTDSGGGGGLLSVSAVPAIDTDPSALLGAAEAMGSAGHALRTRAESAEAVWDGLPQVYAATGTEPLYGQFRTVASHATGIDGALRSAGDALSELALQLGQLVHDRADLVSRITSWRRAYFDAEPDSWERMQATSALDGLRDEVGSFAARLQLAEQACIDALDGIRGGNITGVAGSGVLAISGSSYAAALSVALGDVVGDQLEALAAMSPEEATAWLAAHPEFAAALAASPPPAEDVAAWWASLDSSPDRAALMAALILAMPGTIGNLNGVPYWARSEGNEIVLTDQLAAAEAEYAPLQGQGSVDEFGLYWPTAAEGDAAERLEQLQAIQDALDRDPVYQLTEFHPGQPPLAAVATGDLDSASHIGVVVPGIETTTADMVGAVSVAETLQQAQQELDPGATPVMVAWIGYETPTTFTVWENSYAETGGQALGNALDGIEATNGSAYTTVYAHSYGSTTAVEALRYDDHGVDALAMYGSAGLTVDHVDDIQLPADQVWAGEAYDDDIANIGRGGGSEHPHDPSSEDFGAQVYTVPPSGTWFWQAHDQAEYFQDESLDNLAAIGMGQDDLVSRGPYTPPPVELIGP